ncbi:MAG: VCBS repeat-containing protein [Bacteroidaceae bacterium]|nr:VCBS repeat-containing protein [Bacteroidaceae bacterium]
MNTRQICITLCLVGIGMNQGYAHRMTDGVSQDSTKSVSIIEPDSVNGDALKDTIGPVRSYPTGNTCTDPILVPAIPSTATHYTYSDEVTTNNYRNNYTGTNRKDVYYTFTLPKEMIATLNNDHSIMENTHMYLLNSSLTLLDENDDYYGDGHCTVPTQAYIRTPLPAGSYFVVIEGKTYDGYITTNMTFDAVPEGDTQPSPIIAGTYSSSFNYSDTRNTSQYSNRTGQPANDVYYRFTLGSEMNVTITNDGSVLGDTYLYLLNSSGTVITSNDNYSGGGHCSDTCQAFINMVLDAGTYYVVTEGNTLNGGITTHISGNTEAGYGYPVIPSSYSSMPGTGVGAMGGRFGVSAMGGATYSIPITVPQGVGGLQPQLSIVYSSQSGNGLCGYGASLAGISSITRGPKDIYHDNAARGISYLADDALYLDGVRLILSSGTAGQNNTVYHPESDPFTDVVVHNSCTSTSNNIWFEVKSPDGMVYEYGYKTGTNNNASLSYTSGTSQRIHSWYISSARQPNGNYMEYTYQQSGKCVYPYKIRYGGNAGISSSHFNEIEFGYEYRSDEIPVRFDGQQGSMDQRLKTITGRTGSTTYRTYTLDYNTTGDGSTTKFSRLAGVIEKNAQNETLPATRFNWNYLPEVNYLNSTFQDPQITHELPFSDQSYAAGDINGDGISDIVGCGLKDISDLLNNYIGQVYAYVYLSQINSNGTISYPNGFEYELDEVYSFSKEDISFMSCVQKTASIIDFDGDGLSEFIVPFYRKYDDQNKIYKLILCGINQNTGASEAYQLEGSVNSWPLYATGDLDNNGTGDVVVLETSLLNGKYRCRACHNNPIYDTVYTSVMNLDIANEPKKMFLSDMDGNGMADMMVIHDNGYVIYWNQGYGTNVNFFSDSYKTTNTSFTNLFLMTPGDFNGDGLLDILTNDTGSSNWYFLINNGNGTFTSQLACSMGIYDQDFTSYDDDKFHCDVIDFDGDGKSDVIITKADYEECYNEFLGIPYGKPWGEFDKTHTYWMRSTGTSLTQVYHATSNNDYDAYSNRYITGDFDGDGRMELINYGYDCAHGVNSNSSPVWRIYKNSGFTVQSGKVTSFTGDYGATTSVAYSTLADTAVYSKGTVEAYPAPRYTIPLNVVRQTVQSNGAAGTLTTNYGYEGLKAHLRGRGLLGFSKVTEHNTTTGVTTETGITQWDTAHYIPLATYSRTSIDGSNDTALTVNTLTIVDKGGKKYFAYPSETVETDMDGFSVTTTRTFNTTYGYPTSETVNYGTNMYQTVTYSGYILAGGSYHPCTVVATRRHVDDTSPFSTTTTYSYSSSGFVTRKTENRHSSDSLITRYTYDDFGNLTSQVSTYACYDNPCTTYYTYDATHRFPVRIYTDPASSVRKYTYDTWGNVLTCIDSINTQTADTVTNTYDHWGTLVRTQNPGGDEVTYTRGWSGDPAQRWYVLEQGPGRPWVKTWYDDCGRGVKTESIGPGNVNISGSTTYSYGSHELTVSRTDINGDLTLSYSSTYDTRGRMKAESFPGGASRTYTYGHSGNLRTVKVTENGSNSRATTYRYDVWGNLKEVTGPGSSTVSNDYYSHGGIMGTSSGGASWSFGYDDRGNRTSMNDPDAGITTYSYDAFGREIQRTDARGVAFETNYDYLGRVTSVSASKTGSNTETISYTYGGPGDGTAQMRLKSKSLNGWVKEYGYDAHGRVTSETMGKANVISRSKEYTYGSSGLLATETLPGNKVYSYTYDAYGNLTGVSGAGGAVVWSLVGNTGRRTVSHTVLGGNTSYPFVKTRLLDQYGYLDSIRTVHHGDWWYQDDDYNYSPLTGNLTSMRQQWMDYPRTFTYDNLDRLTAVHENNQAIMSMTYASNGNIQSKTGLGQYTYSTSRPHAVQTVENTGGEIELGEQDITYNLWGKASTVWCYDDDSFYYYTAEYGPDLERVWTTLVRSYHTEYEKFQWGDYEEKRTDGVTTRFYFVDGGDGLAGLHTVRDAQGGAVTHTAATMTDHLGSLMSMADNSDWCFDAHYDPWGHREVSYPYLYSIERGFTGHEQLDGLRLIDMGGRMYDPQLGRFLSPDNFVQAPDDPQNYNRYSYCLNNPLKYTDSDGELIGIVAASLTITGMTNLLTQSYKGYDKSFSDAMSAFFGGVAAGLSEASSWAFGFAELASGTPFGILIGHCINFGKSVNATTTFASSVASVIDGNFNAGKIFLGRYYTDENGNAWEQVLQGLSRFTWEAPQTWAGYNWSHIRNIIGDVDKVDYLGGATFLINENGSLGSVSLGNYINADIPGSYNGRITGYPVLMHEYGHTFDSREMGPMYLFTIGIPSAKSAKNSSIDNGFNHDWYWTELRANRAAKKYFGRYYGVDWSQYETEVESKYYYPVVSPTQEMIDKRINYINRLYGIK